MERVIAAVILVAASASADLVSQSDWSGGPGVQGPVLTWGSDFSIDTSISWFSASGFLKLAGGVPTDFEEGSAGLAVADIDGDGDLDIAAACYYASKIVWWENTSSSGKRWTEHTIQAAFGYPQGIVCADFDNDGDSDVACSSTQSSNLSWWVNDGNGQTWTGILIDNSMGVVQDIHAADINGDGTVDIAGCIPGASDVVWWRNTAAGTLWTRLLVDNSFEGAWGVRCADIDGDGVMDIVACGSGTWAKPVAWWDNTGGSGMAWQEHTIDLKFNGARGLAASDIDGDGDLDVAGAAMTDNDVLWWENTDGAGASWAEHVVDAAFDGAFGILVTDVDKNSFPDIVASSRTGGDVYWYGNIGGSGTIWEKNILTLNQPNAFPLLAGDFDMNGSGELVTGGSALSILWDFDDYMFEGALESSILDTQCDPEWGLMLWSAYTPSGTQVSFRFRSSDDPVAMGDWSDTMVSPGNLGAFVSDGDRYFQYRVRLATTTTVTPVLNDVTIAFEPLLGTGGGGVPAVFDLMPVTPNPSSGPVTLEFASPAASAVSFSIFDLSGRLVCQAGPSVFDQGWHAVQVGDLRPGVYFARMEACGFEAAERFVVVD